MYGGPRDAGQERARRWRAGVVVVQHEFQAVQLVDPVHLGVEVQHVGPVLVDDLPHLFAVRPGDYET